MSSNRVQKLLFSEYCDFEDIVLIESPFAQTTKQGTGLRQVHLGLTPSKLILATDILPPVEPDNVKFNPFVDPEIETFELIAIYPVECVNLSIYRRRKRQAIKARFCNNRVLYFELGGFERRGMFWNLWCEKVKFLCPVNSGSSRSETSVATSTSGSSLYLVDKKIVAKNGIKQLWCKFGPNFGFENYLLNGLLQTNSQSLVRKWTDRYLYLGKDIHEAVLQYKPIMKLPSKNEFAKPKRPKSRSKHVYPTLVDQENLAFGNIVQVNRFGSGVHEGCGTGLYLTVDDYMDPKLVPSYRTTSSDPSIDLGSIDYDEIAETAVLIWEYYGFYSRENKRQIRHRRRYGFAPKPLFLYGLGPWHISKGDKFSTQLKRALSDVNLTNLNNRKNLKLPVSRRQLYATVSCPVLNEENRTNNIINAPKKPVIFFWTPGYWYRPISAKDAYSELQKHLKKIREYHQSNFKCNSRKCNNRRFLRKFNVGRNKETDEDEDFSERRQRKRGFISSMLSSKHEHWDYDDTKRPNETPLEHLQRILRVDLNVTAWDFDSTTLAEQLTMIDRDLFLKVPSSELDVLVWQRSSKNAPNIAAMIAFSYRISCLIASEILRDECEKIRARLMARFINVANKCHRISNFHSCRSVLCGLQTPAIFRLRKTWAYVRKKHASKYQEFEYLCRLYRDTRMPSFQRTFFIFSQHPPYLPYIGHIITKLFDKIPEYKVQKRDASRQLSFCTIKSSSSYKSEIRPALQPQINLFSKIFGVFSNPLTNYGDGDSARQKRTIKKAKASTRSIKFKSLHEYFKPLKTIEDNRKEMLIEVTELLEKSQLGAMNYNFIYNEMARDFLLKTRYTEEQDNFFNSIGLESS